jgi:hypothetical protein
MRQSLECYEAMVKQIYDASSNVHFKILIFRECDLKWRSCRFPSPLILLHIQTLVIKIKLRRLHTSKKNKFGNQILQQSVGIPIGTISALLLADLFLYSYEAKFVQTLLQDNTCNKN